MMLYQLWSIMFIVRVIGSGGLEDGSHAHVPDSVCLRHEECFFLIIYCYSDICLVFVCSLHVRFVGRKMF